MSDIYGTVEIRRIDEWLSVINVSSLLMKHLDLNGCLFGVDNYAGYVPLFAERGLPSDCSAELLRDLQQYLRGDGHASWVSWHELRAVDWEENAPVRDQRITEFAREGDREVAVTKWLNDPHWAWVRDALVQHPEAVIETDQRVFRRLILKRSDCLADTEFPLLMKLMACLAERFGDDNVRLVVWFD
jgi:hypothetical protein